MSVKDTLQLAALGIGAYLLYRFYNTASQVAAPAANAIASFYTWATLPASMVVQGNMVFADGSTVPLAQVDVRQNPNGSVNAAYAGHIYQLAPSDANGNWPATLVQ
jgi:hypothetical protein